MFAPVVAACALLAPKTENVLFVFTDGLRWQEVFTGAEADLVGKDKTYWAETPEARRAALMPFTWSVVGKQGQLFGNRTKGSDCQVANPLKFSYPGYSETMQGFYDPVITSNDPVPNPNATVFEWLAKKPEFKGKVAGFANWDVVSAIFNKARCGFFTQCGPEPIRFADTPESRLYNKMLSTTNRPFPPDPDDTFTHEAALMYLKAKKPRVMAVLYGETDSWAHSGDYSKYLSAVHRFDTWMREIWETVQSMPGYRGKTTMVVTTDHGRGVGKEWTSHGQKIDRAEQTWIMVVGPDTPALGERTNVPAVTNGQVATTIAALLGQDYRAAQPKAAPVLPVIASRR
ncbi:MAG: alkaline phosphatase family protein [Fimbriimonadaceae bacterium]|nr:alkaline phosphatase family protein [Fimbriimonadaceae bacterium]